MWQAGNQKINGSIYDGNRGKLDDKGIGMTSFWKTKILKQKNLQQRNYELRKKETEQEYVYFFHISI